MPRSMWKGAIQFGLVTIPIRLYLATDSKGISFNMLHETDRSRIQMKIWCPEDEQVISRSETVRGYEYAPDRYVVITDEDLEKVPLRTVRSLEIERFVPAERVDDRDETSADGGRPLRFVKQAYYVEPEKIGRKAFYLLRGVLAEKGLSAICKIVIRDREALAKLDPYASTMLLTTLHWPDEIRAIDELDLADPAELAFKPAERKMAEQLVDAMTGEFDAGEYRDEYRDALLQVIEAKVEGHEIVVADEAPAAKVVDLMAALQASVDAARSGRGGSRESAPTSVASAASARASGARRKTTSASGSARGKEEAARGTRKRGRTGRDEARSAEGREEEAAPARRRKAS